MKNAFITRPEQTKSMHDLVLDWCRVDDTLNILVKYWQLICTLSDGALLLFIIFGTWLASEPYRHGLLCYLLIK